MRRGVAQVAASRRHRRWRQVRPVGDGVVAALVGRGFTVTRGDGARDLLIDPPGGGAAPDIVAAL
ncbi:MAG: hypothetical protein ACK5LN_00510, partial [Propioniciclava sp.]